MDQEIENENYDAEDFEDSDENELLIENQKLDNQKLQSVNLNNQQIVIFGNQDDSNIYVYDAGIQKKQQLKIIPKP